MSLEKVARKKNLLQPRGKKKRTSVAPNSSQHQLPFFIPFLMLTALFVFPENRAGHKHRGGRGGGSTHSPALYTIGIETPSAVAASFPSTSSNKDAVTSPPRGSISVSITDATDQRARKDAVCDMIASSREDLCRSIIAPLVTSIVPPAPGLPREYHPTRSYAQQPQYAQGTVVLDGSSKSRNHILFDPYDGLLVTAIRDLATKETTKAVFLSAVELDEHNQLIDLLSAEARAQRSASPGVALRAGVVRHQIPTVVEDTTDRFTAIEETTFEDVSKDCHVTLHYLASKCQGDTRHQVISVVVVHRQQRSTDATIDGDNGSAAVGATPNTTLQFVSLVVNEITRGTRATRHCVQNVASLLESRSNAVSFTSTKVLFLLKPVLTGKQPGAWITLLDPHGAATSVVTTTSAAIDAVPPTSESFKDAFSVLQTLSRVSGAARNGNAECLLWNHSSSFFPLRSLVGNTNEQLQISTSSSTGTGAALDTTLRRASRLTEEIDKRFQQLSGAVPPSSASHSRAVNPHVDSHQQVPQQQHQQRERSSSISSSDLEPRQQHPTPVVVTMSRNGAAQQQQQLRQSRSHHTTPIHQRFAVDDDDDSSRRRRAHTPQQTTTTRHVKDMQRRIRYLEQSESTPHDGSHRRGGPTQIIQNLGDDDDFYDNQGGGYRAQPSSSQRNKTNNNSKSQDHFITRGKATQSPYRTTKAVKDVSDNDNDVNNNNGDGEYRSSSPLVQRLKKELAKEKSHSSSMLHNYETYKHTMEGVLLRLRKDLEGQSIKLEDTQKQLRLRDKILRNGNDGHQVKTRELESVTTKLKQLEELHHSAAADHQQQKSAWKAQRVELHKSNDQLQHRVNDLLETINGLEGLLAKSHEQATSRTRGLTMSATTMTTVSGLVNVSQEAALQKMALDGGGGGFYAVNSSNSLVSMMSSPPRHFQSAHASFTRGAPGALVSRDGSSPALVSQIPTVGIPRGTQTTFPTFTELQHEMREKDLLIESQQEDIRRLSDDVKLMTSREHSLHKRIDELEMDVSSLEEREIAAKSTLLKTEQLLRVERQESDRKKHHRESNVVSTGCQATPAPELHDILINDLEVANGELQQHLKLLKVDLETAAATLREAEADHNIALAEKDAEIDAARGTQERALEELRDEHVAEIESLRERVYTLENMLEEQRLRSTNISPQSMGGSSGSPTEHNIHMYHQSFLASTNAYAIEVPGVYRQQSSSSQHASPPAAAILSSTSGGGGGAMMRSKTTSPPSGSRNSTGRRGEFPQSPLPAAAGSASSQRQLSPGSPMVSTATQRKPAAAGASRIAASHQPQQQHRVLAPPSASSPSPNSGVRASSTSTLLASPPQPSLSGGGGSHGLLPSQPRLGASPQGGGGMASPNTQFHHYMSRGGGVVGAATTTARVVSSSMSSGGGILKKVPPPGAPAAGATAGGVAPRAGGGGILRR